RRSIEVEGREHAIDDPRKRDVGGLGHEAQPQCTDALLRPNSCELPDESRLADARLTTDQHRVWAGPAPSGERQQAAELRVTTDHARTSDRRFGDGTQRLELQRAHGQTRGRPAQSYVVGCTGE